MSFQFERSRKARADRPFVSISAKAAGALLLLSLAAPSFAQVSLTTLDTPYTQNFDALPNTGTTNAWTNNATLAGWYAQKTSGTVVLIASDGSSNTGGLYSFGTTAATERALGSVESSGTGTMYYGLRLANNTGSTITSLTFPTTASNGVTATRRRRRSRSPTRPRRASPVRWRSSRPPARTWPR